MKIKQYFKITELADAAVCRKYGEQVWAFFDPRLLDVLVWLREGLNTPLVVNTTTQQQRGLRTNISPLVQAKTKAGAIYLSAHCLGKGADLNAAGNKMTAAEIRKWVRANIATCPHNIRLESDKSAPTWVHIDVMNTTDKKLIEFSA